MSKINYLNNRELMKEIHNSKTSFCYYIDDKYSMYDIIVDSIDDIDSKVVKQAIQNRAERLTKDSKYEAKENKNKVVEIVNYEDIVVEDLVFRVMTEEHVPLDESKKATKPDSEKKVKTNFPPFKHYILDSYIKNRLGNFKELTFKEVGRSHWTGGLHNGHFTVDHGRINHKLAVMFMKLSDRYAQRGNWRGYSYVDEMKNHALLQLSAVGLKFNEAKSSNPFSYYTETITNSFTRVLNLEKQGQNIRDDLLMAQNLTPSFSKQNEDNEETRRFDILEIDPEIITSPRRGRRRAPKSGESNV